MLRALLYDAAVAAAKGYSHAQVEPRHVIFATAKHFGRRPEVKALIPLAKRALEPRGMAHQVPTPTPEALALLDAFSTESEALAGLLAALHGDPSQGLRPSLDTPSTAQASPPAKTTGEEAATTRPGDIDKETVSVILAELDKLIGLESVKRQLRRVIAVVQANQERARAGLKPVNPGLHLVFTGPPGTGKTTVARLVARLYAATGALPGHGFTEASRSDLVAAYIGQTAIKTAELIARTRPGVLFVDEAYSLTPHHERDFGAEAIATLVKAMEDYRDDFAVIVAGYGDEMSAFIASNPGLKSRFKTYIAFPDYTPAELTQIFQDMAAATGMSLKEGVLKKAETVFQRAVRDHSFGNARFARSLFEEAYARMSARAAADGSVHVDELKEIGLEDIDWDESRIEREIRRIGFTRE